MTELLECNRCGQRRQTKPDETVEQLRHRLMDFGWYVNVARDIDLCPGCTHHGLPDGDAS